MKRCLPSIFIAIFVFSVYSFAAKAQIMTDSLYNDYDWRIEQPFLYDVYIPLNEDDAFAEIQRLAEKQGIDKFKSAPEDSIKRRLHFGLGKWMMKNWQLVNGSRLSHYLKLKGLTHPDDMVEYLIVSFHRYLNEQNRNEEELIDYYIEERKKIYQQQQERLNKVVIDTLKVDESKNE